MGYVSSTQDRTAAAIADQEFLYAKKVRVLMNIGNTHTSVGV